VIEGAQAFDEAGGSGNHIHHIRDWIEL
jgi:hypothetical protein